MRRDESGLLWSRKLGQQAVRAQRTTPIPQPTEGHYQASAFWQLATYRGGRWTCLGTERTAESVGVEADKLWRDRGEEHIERSGATNRNKQNETASLPILEGREGRVEGGMVALKCCIVLAPVRRILLHRKAARHHNDATAEMGVTWTTSTDGMLGCVGYPRGADLQR